MSPYSSQRGFSLVELLVALTISGIVATAIIGVFVSQNRAHVGQEMVTDMQQNMRASLGFITRELRMAGYDPSRSGNMDFSNPGIDSITFRMDLNGDGDSADDREEISYSLDAGTLELKRKPSAAGTLTVMADDVEKLAFAYAFDSDNDGNLEVDGGGDTIFAIAGSDGAGPLNGSVNWYDLAGNDTGIAATDSAIRAVMIWVLVRSSAPDPNYRNTNTYEVGKDSFTFNDNYRRRLLNTGVRCRNMGL